MEGYIGEMDSLYVVAHQHNFTASQGVVKPTRVGTSTPSRGRLVTGFVDASVLGL
jgi:hypothetical protein